MPIVFSNFLILIKTYISSTKLITSLTSKKIPHNVVIVIIDSNGLVIKSIPIIIFKIDIITSKTQLLSGIVLKLIEICIFSKLLTIT